MTERDGGDDEGLSTDVGNHPEFGTRIGGVPGNSGGADISGGPGGGTGWGAWPTGMGTTDDAPASREEPEIEGERIGARRGQGADRTGPVTTEASEQQQP